MGTSHFHLGYLSSFTSSSWLLIKKLFIKCINPNLKNSTVGAAHIFSESVQLRSGNTKLS